MIHIILPTGSGFKSYQKASSKVKKKKLPRVRQDSDSKVSGRCRIVGHFENKTKDTNTEEEVESLEDLGLRITFNPPTPGQKVNTGM